MAIGLLFLLFATEHLLTQSSAVESWFKNAGFPITERFIPEAYADEARRLG